MNTYQNQHSIGSQRQRTLGLLLFSILFAFTNVAAQSSSTIVEYETRIAAPNAAVILGVDEVIFRWSYDTAVPLITTGIVTEADLVDFSLKVDDTTPLVGGIFIDEIIIDGVVQDAVSPSTGGNSEARSLSDVIWEFDLNANSGEGELLSFRNVVDVPSSGGFFKVEDTPDNEYDVVTYDIGDDKSWTTAKLAAEGAGGYLAIVTSQVENDYLNGLRNIATGGLLQFEGTEYWLGGFQPVPTGPQLPTDDWQWVNGDPIPGINGSSSGYSNWGAGEPNDSGSGEAYLALGLFGENQWNDEGNLTGIGGYIIEIPTGARSITEYNNGSETSDTPHLSIKTRLGYSANTSYTRVHSFLARCAKWHQRRRNSSRLNLIIRHL